MATLQDIYDKLFDPNTVCVALISHGKDSMAMLRAIKLLKLPLHRIITTDLWATQDIPAVVPEMWKWKKEADKIINEIYEIEVEHICAMKGENKICYSDIFYKTLKKGKYKGSIYGFPVRNKGWCHKIKYDKIDIEKYILSSEPKNKIQIVKYLGIAADETLRIARYKNDSNILLPLAEIGWDEDLCGLIAGYQNLLSPIYNNASREGCWFCHNQGVDQLRKLRKNYPDLWSILLKWDSVSPVPFKADGHTVHDFDARFALEDEGWITPNEQWKWAYLDDMPIQMRLHI